MTAVEISELVRNYGIVIGGIVGLALAFWRGIALSRQSKASAEQARIARRAHVTELFNKAVEQLGNEKLEIRLGAIYTLKRISEDFPDFADSVFQLLSAYVRERSRDSVEAEPSVDFKEIMQFLRDALTEDARHGN